MLTGMQILKLLAAVLIIIPVSIVVPWLITPILGEDEDLPD